ncbi:2-dehydro-3-deoxygalactonokinase [Salinicoccus sesuvii]|uniref:2-dehydro-3-deoxygalactonokinase n=1 Tax=Salinicoccus sesuvii TaxID=868281 RepID=A0ABV7N5H7_9STAP
MYVILIDSGTTNTRIRIVDEQSKTVIDALKIEVGVKNAAMDKSNKGLKTAIEQGIKEVLDKNALEISDIGHIIASGMITSNLGLREVPHIVAPANVDDFRKGMEKDEIYGISCYFIPGMKNKAIDGSGTLEEIREMDIMRGEEVEVFGLLEQMDISGEGVIVLPGSHTKFVRVSKDKQLISCFSTLGGELVQAVQSNTILSSSLEDGLIDTLETEHLENGYLKAKTEGLTRSLFGVRLLDMYTAVSGNQRANYLLGAIYHEDVQALKFYTDGLDLDWLIVGGSEILKNSMSHLLSLEFSDKKIIKASQEVVEQSYITGSIMIHDNH